MYLKISEETDRSTKQTQTIQKLIPGQTEIKQTNNLIKLSHRIRHWFMNSIVRSMEINTQKFGTEQVRYRGVI
jgi:hypothetical protein